MAKKRSTAAFVLAIFHLIFGVIGLPSAAAQMAGFTKEAEKMISKMDPKQAKATEVKYQVFDRELPNYRTFEIVTGLVQMILNGLLIAAGIGLIKMQPWGRYASIAYGALTITFVLGYAIFFFQVVTPVMNMAAAELNRTDKLAGTMMQMTAVTTPITVGCMGIIYPIIVLIIMSLPGVRQAFRPDQFIEKPVSAAEDDYGYYERERENP